tara:strand:- start:377 stop:562 length:186 start_codon:yes stop_codon:yes gene_type:complete
VHGNMTIDAIEDEYVFAPDVLKTFCMSLILRILNKNTIESLMEGSDKKYKKKDFVKKEKEI